MASGLINSCSSVCAASRLISGDTLAVHEYRIRVDGPPDLLLLAQCCMKLHLKLSSGLHKVAISTWQPRSQPSKRHTSAEKMKVRHIPYMINIYTISTCSSGYVMTVIT